MDSRVPRGGGQISLSPAVPTCKDVAADYRPLGLIGTVCSRRQGEDASPPVQLKLHWLPATDDPATPVP